MVEGEVNLVDLIRYCALESQVPFLSERLQHRVQMVTVDERELTRLLPPLKSEDKIIQGILGRLQRRSAVAQSPASDLSRPGQTRP